MKALYHLFHVFVLTIIMIVVTLYLKPTVSGAKVQSTDGEYSADVSEVFWVGEDSQWFRMEDSEGFLIDLESLSQSRELFLVEAEGFKADDEETQLYEFHLQPVKSGKTTITVTFTTEEDQVKRQASFELEVKKYPNAIRSLNVNRKNVKIAAKVKSDEDQRFSYTVRNTKQYGTIKMSLKKGWKISSVKGIYSMGSDYYETKKIAKNTITNGKRINFVKQWDELSVFIVLKNSQGDAFTYTVNMER